MKVSRQRKEECRTRLMIEAATLFGEKGFDATTTRDIAVAAGLATGTMFNYFPSKETLAMTLVAHALQQGHDDYLRRRTEEEELAEDLFLFIASGLRQLQPLRPFIGPVLERSFSPFPGRNTCPEGDAARHSHLAAVQEIISRHGFSETPDYVAMTMYWSLYLGILAFWTNDASPNQEETRGLMDYTTRFFATVISGGPAGPGVTDAGS